MAELVREPHKAAMWIYTRDALGRMTRVIDGEGRPVNLQIEQERVWSRREAEELARRVLKAASRMEWPVPPR